MPPYVPLPLADRVDRVRALMAVRDAAAPNFEAVDGADGPQVALVVGLASHCHVLARCALQLLDASLSTGIPPLVRQAFECGVTALWVALVPDAWQGLANTNTVARATMAADLVEHGLDVPEPIAEAVARRKDGLLETSIAHDSFAERLGDIQGGSSMYPAYRALCEFSHSSETVARQYFVMDDQGKLGGLSHEPTESNPLPWVSVLSWALLMAGQAEDALDRTHRSRDELRVHARALRFEGEPRASDRVRERAGRAMR